MKIKIKKKSFVLILIFFFWIGYTSLSLFQTIYATISSQEKFNRLKNRNIDFILESSQLFISSENIEFLQEQLVKAAELKFIDYFCFKKSSSVLFEYYPNSEVSACEMIDKFDSFRSDAFYQFSKRVVRPLKIDSYLLLVGYNTDLTTFLIWEHLENLGPFLKDILIITSFLGFLVFLIMKDFLLLDRMLQKGAKGGDFSKIKARSREAQSLIDSTNTLSEMNSAKSSMIHHLQNTVGLAIHSEIDKGTPHLTQIPSAVVRIDLNGYTQIFLEKKEEHIVTVLNEYFSVTNDLIKRFEGEIYQIIGDEIIFILKNKDPRSALFCVRAIFEWAQELDLKIQAEYKHRFLLKASISYGSLRFVQLNNGYAFAGVPLIESVRMLGCVSDKSENTLVIKKDGMESSMAFMKNPTSKMVDLKGFEEKSEILEIKEFVTLKDFFRGSFANGSEAEQKENMKSLTFFRGQQDILGGLQVLNKFIFDHKWIEVAYMVGHLKDLKLGIRSGPIVAQLYQILSDHFPLITVRSKDYPVLNSLILMAESLVHPDLWTQPWEALIKNYLLCSQPRIVANATEVLCRFNYDSKEIQAILLNWKDNNRICANFLLAEMRKSITKANAKTLISWLDSDQLLFQASALYVLEEILRYYQTHDPVVFKTNSLLAACISEADFLKSSSHSIIKSRIEKLQKVLVNKESGENAA